MTTFVSGCYSENILNSIHTQHYIQKRHNFPAIMERSQRLRSATVGQLENQGHAWQYYKKNKGSSKAHCFLTAVFQSVKRDEWVRACSTFQHIICSGISLSSLMKMWLLISKRENWHYRNFRYQIVTLQNHNTYWISTLRINVILNFISRALQIQVHSLCTQWNVFDCGDLMTHNLKVPHRVFLYIQCFFGCIPEV